MKRWGLLAVMGVATMGSAACGGAGVGVQAQVEQDGETVPLADLPIQVNPYDRDAIFDSLEAAYGQPEPQLPDSLAELQERYAQLQTANAEAQDRWATIRDTLQQLNKRMGQLPKSSAEYRVLYSEWSQISGQEAGAKRAMDAAFTDLEGVRKNYTSQVEEIKTRQELWADEAFADYGDVVAARLQETRRTEVSDTTDANGQVSISLKPGQYWVVARHDLAFEELYWNVPIEVSRGEFVQLVLNRANAEVRPKY